MFTGLSYSHFLCAEEPPMYGFSDDAFQLFEKSCTAWGYLSHAFQLFKKSCTAWGYLNHLRPGRKFLYKDIRTGKYAKITMKKCGGCKKIAEKVKDEHCASKYCGGSSTRCATCTTRRTCATCGQSGCVCRFSTCCVDGCKKSMCNCSDFDAYKFDEAGPATGCSCVVYGIDEDSDDYGDRKYCQEHKPEGAVPFTGMH